MKVKLALRASYIICMILGQLWGSLVHTVAISLSIEDQSLELMAPSPITPNATCGEWASWLPPRIYPAVVMQVVSKDYAHLQHNFMLMMELNSVFTRKNMFLMCTDDESVEIFEALGVRCVPLGALPFHSVQDVWRTRIRALSCLVTQGYDVIMSDADALWLGDPMDYFSMPSVRGSSVVASRGTLPNDLSKKWGSAMCMGFIMYRATGAGMDALQRSMEELVIEDGDDQVAANIALDQFRVIWDEDSDMRLRDSTGLGRGTIEGLRSEYGPFVVTLLPQSSFTRQCSHVPISNDTVVAHCNIKKDRGNRGRAAWMQDENLWLVKTESP